MCDLCASPEAIYIVDIESSRLRACEKCSSHGKLIGRIHQEASVINSHGTVHMSNAPITVESEKETETMQLIVKDYPSRIKGAREGMGLKQEEIARRIAEKESVIHKLESGSMKPSIKLARKLEKYLRISLIESVELASPGSYKSSGGDSQGVTIGDMIKKRKK